MDTQLDALPTLPVLARTVSGWVNSAFLGLELLKPLQRSGRSGPFTAPPLPPGSTLLGRWGRRWGRLLSQGDRVRRGVGPAVGDGDQDVGDSALASDFLGNAAHHDLRLSGLAGPHLDVGPGDAPAPARAHSLEDRLLGRPPAREVLDRVLPRLAIANLPGRVNPPQEQLAVLLDHLADPRAFDDVAADSQDLHAQRPSQENGSPAEFDSISVYWAPETWPSWEAGAGSVGGCAPRCHKLSSGKANPHDRRRRSMESRMASVSSRGMSGLSSRPSPRQRIVSAASNS